MSSRPTRATVKPCHRTQKSKNKTSKEKANQLWRPTGSELLTYESSLRYMLSLASFTVFCFPFIYLQVLLDKILIMKKEVIKHPLFTFERKFSYLDLCLCFPVERSFWFVICTVKMKIYVDILLFTILKKVLQVSKSFRDEVQNK